MMKINKVDVNRRCDHGICQEKAAIEIVLGGYKNRILLCAKCYEELKNQMKTLGRTPREKQG